MQITGKTFEGKSDEYLSGYSDAAENILNEYRECRNTIEVEQHTFEHGTDASESDLEHIQDVIDDLSIKVAAIMVIKMKRDIERNRAKEGE